tara:strand:+ start:1613 stop:2266 length:654 start_codon:yes stop_codon:yes gene_type:complete
MISILMPIYNGIEFINESVMSIIGQTYEEWELIIGINGHPKDSDVYKTAKQYEGVSNKIRVYDLIECKGKSESLNEMVKHCQYDWVSLLDVDDKWLPMKLERQLPYMKEYDVIGTQCQYFGDINSIPNIPLGDLSGLDFRKVNPIINSSCLIKKSVARWDNNYNGVEDYKLWVELWSQKKKFYNVPDILVMHRIHRNSAFNAKGNHNKVGELLEKYK